MGEYYSRRMGRAEVADVHDYGELALSATSVESEVVMPSYTKAHARTPINHMASLDRRVVGEEVLQGGRLARTRGMTYGRSLIA
jgi:hypothetical protein